MKLTNKSYWESAHKATGKATLLKRLFRFREEKIISKLIQKYIPQGDYSKQVIEIGCYPGEYLRILEKHGYNINGIDFIDSSAKMHSSFKNDNLHVTEIIQADFLEHQFSKKYDVVMSFGFVEHFNDYIDIIDRHCNLVEDGGYLLITAPNYRVGLQKKMISFFDSHEAMETLVLESMNPKEWETAVANNDFQILFCGYFGLPRIVRGYKGALIKRAIFLMILIFLRAIRFIPLLFESQSGAFSSNIGIVARKRDSI